MSGYQYSAPMPLRQRWLPLMDDPSFQLQRLGDIFEPLASGKVDGRGFPFWLSKEGPFARMTHEGLKFSNVDFSDAQFTDCSLVQMVFVDCIFDESSFEGLRCWDCVFVGCRFSSCTFTKGQMGLDSHYQDCHFDKCKFLGASRSQAVLGSFTKYLLCNFEQCTFQLLELHTLDFIKCRFASKFTKVKFLGKHATSHFGGSLGRAVRLDECIFSDSSFKQCAFDADVHTNQTVLPEMQ